VGRSAYAPAGRKEEHAKSRKVSRTDRVRLPVGRAQLNILTANGNNDRTNANLQESQLSPATVTRDSFGKIGTFAVDGQVYAQALYASGISIPGKGAQNLVFVSTMHNSVYAFNAGAPPAKALVWQVNLGPSVPSQLLFGRYTDIANEVGILGTGAIDLQRGVLYVVADTLRNGAPVFYLHALDLATGAERLNGPVTIAASVPGKRRGREGGRHGSVRSAAAYSTAGTAIGE